MEHINLKARAKINLALDILGRRDDGYHELRTVFQSLELYDDIHIRKTDKQTLKVVSNLTWLPCDERNLAYKAADFIISEYGIRSGVFIKLEKRIPVSAGLAGGSSDCAAALIGMNRLFNLNLTDMELTKIGKQFGADVPYCILRGTMLAEGIGEKLTRLPPHPQVFVLLARPPFSVSTQTVFKNYDPEKVDKHPDIDEMIRRIAENDLPGIAAGFSNVLESVTMEMHPIIGDIKKIMLGHNALGSLMSGSGPTVFGYFTNKSDAFRAISDIRQQMAGVKDIYLTKIFNPLYT